MNKHKVHIVLCFLLLSIASSAQATLDLVIDNLTCIEAIQQISVEAKLDLTMGGIQDSKRKYSKSYIIPILFCDVGIGFRVIRSEWRQKT